MQGSIISAEGHQLYFFIGCRLSGSALGRKGIQAEQVGADAADMLLRNLSYGCCVDEFLQDQVSSKTSS